ncbi:MAG: guanylate kinase [Clostridiales bacterium]|nr:guanylate kinase [Clostridiales bacterium]HAW16329.1 guanylate kinase [Clostridiales bacterium]
MKKGLIVSVSGPSGVGKGTVLAKIRELMPECGQSISVTTRSPRGAEKDGVEYYFRTKDEFMELVETGEIIEYDTYVGNCYGTPAGPLAEMSEKGKDVLLDLTIAGSLALKARFEQTVTIFILPPSFEALKERLEGRGTEDKDLVAKRMDVARSEICEAGKFDYVVINDDLDETVRKVVSIIEAEKCRYKRNEGIERSL